MIRHPDRHLRPSRMSPVPFRPSGVRGLLKANHLRMIVLTLLASFALPSTSSAADVVACQLPVHTVSLSQPGAPQGVTEVHMDNSAGDEKLVTGVVHLDLRNDGPVPVSELCASVHLSNSHGTPQDATVALSFPHAKQESVKLEQSRACLTLSTPWPGYQDASFDVRVQISSVSIPLTGVVLIDATGHASEPPSPSEASTRAAGPRRPTNPPASPPAPIDCVSHAKPLTRSINLLPSRAPCSLYLPLYGGLVVGLIYLGYTLCHFKRKGWLGRPMGGPQWSFGTSFATNFTVGTGLLSLVLGGSVITDALHYMTKTHYVVLTLLFAAVLLIAPALFTFFSTPHECPSTLRPEVIAPAAPVWFFLLTSALMVGAVIGQLITVGLAMDEVRFRGYLSWGTFLVFIVLLGAAGVGAFFAAVGVVPASFQEKGVPKEQVVQQLNTLRNRVAAIHRHVDSFAPGQEPLDDQDMILLERLIAREQAPPKWTMF